MDIKKFLIGQWNKEFPGQLDKITQDSDHKQPEGIKICDDCITANRGYFMALLIQLVKEGELDKLEPIKFETTGAMSPRAKAVIWPRLNLSPPEIFDLEDRFKNSLELITKKLAEVVASERDKVRNEFEKLLAAEVVKASEVVKKAKRKSANKRIRR